MPEEIRNEVMERQERRHDGKGRKHRGHHRHGRPQESVKPGSLKYVWRSVSHNKGAVIGMVLLGLIVVLCLLSPIICRYNYAEMNIQDWYQTPNPSHLLGTDQMGRDLLSRVLYGARYTLIIGITATAMSAVLGILLGAVAGYFGGFVDSCVMRFLDLFQAFPTLVLAMAFCAVFGTGVDKCIFALGITGIPGFARLMRANILRIANMEYIEAAKTIGSTSFFRSAFSVVANVTINRVAGGYSTAALAAISVANRVMDIPFAVILGFGQGYQPIAGFNWGAKQFRRVRDSLKFVVKVSIFGAILFGAILALAASPLIKVFNSQADAEVLRLGVISVRLQSLFLFSHALNSIINMFYAGIGKAKYALLMSTARQGYVFIPVAIIAPMILKEVGVASAQGIADALCLLIAVPLAIKAYRMIDKEESAIAENA